VPGFRFLHSADIHLDSPLRGLARYEGVPADEIRGATRAALENLIEYAIDEKVDFVLIVGDLFDGDWKGVQGQAGQVGKNYTLATSIHFPTH